MRIDRRAIPVSTPLWSADKIARRRTVGFARSRKRQGRRWNEEREGDGREGRDEGSEAAWTEVLDDRRPTSIMKASCDITGPRVYLPEHNSDNSPPTTARLFRASCIHQEKSGSNKMKRKRRKKNVTNLIKLKMHKHIENKHITYINK